MKETSTYLKVRRGTWDSKVLVSSHSFASLENISASSQIALNDFECFWFCLFRISRNLRESILEILSSEPGQRPLRTSKFSSAHLRSAFQSGPQIF